MLNPFKKHHAWFEIRNGEDKRYFTLCDSKKPGKTEINIVWEQVTCKECLKHRILP